MESLFPDDFEEQVKAAIKTAVEETLRAGVPIFYRDHEMGLEIMEQPDGRKFEIRYIPGAPRDRNFEVLRELSRTAA